MLPSETLPRSCNEIEQGIVAGLHVGAQMHVAQAGRVVADFGWGEARPGVSMTADTLMLWLSSGKPVGAVAILQLVERGLVDLQAAVASYIPEFAAGGKQDITVWHLLTHTGGFRWVALPWPTTWEDAIARISRAKLERDWIVGQTAGYHPATSWYILAEIVRRLDGRSYSDYVRAEVFLPLAMRDSWIGMPRSASEAYGNRMGVMLHTEQGKTRPHAYDAPNEIALCVPGGNARGPMHDLGRFYQMLLNHGELDGVRVLSPQSVAMMTSRQREGMYDETFRHVMDWGLGLIVDSNRYGVDTVPYGFGCHSSPRAFGHGGAGSSLAFADPERQLVVAVVFNGMPGEEQHNARLRRLLAALEEDLGSL